LIQGSNPVREGKRQTRTQDKARIQNKEVKGAERRRNKQTLQAL
jgi:hypothetical protein